MADSSWLHPQIIFPRRAQFRNYPALVELGAQEGDFGEARFVRGVVPGEFVGAGFKEAQAAAAAGGLAAVRARSFGSVTQPMVKDSICVRCARPATRCCRRSGNAPPG